MLFVDGVVDVLLLLDCCLLIVGFSSLWSLLCFCCVPVLDCDCCSLRALLRFVCLLFGAVCCLAFGVACRSLLVAPCLVFVACCLSLDVCCVLFVVVDWLAAW